MEARDQPDLDVIHLQIKNRHSSQELQKDSRKGIDCEGVPVTVSVAELGALAPVPTGYTAVVLGDPGEAVHLLGTAMPAFCEESPHGGTAAVAAGELGGKDDLVVLRLAERPDDQIGEGRRGRFGLT